MSGAGIFFNSVFAGNLALATLLGMCTFLAFSKEIKEARWMGLATLIVLIVSVPFNYLLDRFFLSEGALGWLGDSFADADMGFARLIVFAAVAAGTAQIAFSVIKRRVPALENSVGRLLPLTAINCAVIGCSLLMPHNGVSGFGQSIVYALGSGLGWMLAILALAAIRERMSYSRIPEGLRGIGILFITVGLMSLAFMVFFGTGAL